MTTPVNPYKDLAHLETTSVEDVAMKDTLSQTGLENKTGSSSAVDPPSSKSEEVQGSALEEEREEDMVNFEDSNLTLPPSFSQEILEETLWDDKQPFVFWAT